MNSMHAANSTLLHLSLIKHAGPTLIARLLTTVGPENLPELYTWSARDIIERAAVAEQYAQQIIDGLADTGLLEREIELIERADCSWISLVHAQYPELLKHIYAPPTGLYVKGSCDVLRKPSIGIVGSRDAGQYAERVIEALVPPLLEHELVIVSGGARGVDAMAHKAVCALGGQTVVVQGAGLLHLYPVSNRKLFERVLENNGALVSIFPMQLEAAAHTFPIRNRVIAGMARGCVVVQAASKSGAKITASCALQEGRDVFAVPGSIFDPLSQGCHELLADGATLVASADDILSCYGYVQAGSKDSSKKREMPDDRDKQADMFKPAVADDTGLLVFCKEPVSFDELMHMTGMSSQQLHDELFTLQCDGRLQQNFMGLWQRS